MELFRLFGSILIDDKEALKSLKDTEKKAKESEKAMKQLGDGAAKVGQAIAVGIGIGVTALGGLVMKATEATDRIDKMSLKTGLSRKAFQEWDYIMGQNGISIDTMQAGMNKVTNLFDDLKKGSKGATETFGRLGFTMDDLKGKSKDEIFAMTIQSLQGMTDETERAALANDLFGKSGSELAPLLNAGAEGTELLRQRAYELGLVLNDEAIDAGVKFGDTLDDMKQSFGAIGNEIGVAVMPLFQSFLDWILENMPQIKEIAGNIFTAIGDAIKWVSDNSNWLIPILAGVLGAFVALKIIGVVSAMIGIFNAVMGAAAVAGGIFNLVMLANPLTWVVLAIVAVVAAITALIMNFDKVKTAALGLWDKIKEVFGGIRDFIKGIFDNFRNVIKLPKLTITGSLNPIKWVTEGLPKLNVKWNAEGGIFDSPTIFGTQYGLQGVGEAGPEAIMPLSKLQDLLDMNTIDYDQLALAFKKALKGMAMQMNDEKFGEFIDTRLIRGTV